MVAKAPERRESEHDVRAVEIDFLYLDLATCGRCIGTDRNLEEALVEVAGVLQGAGLEVVLRKTQVESEAQARELRFYSSPTIRVNRRDIALEFRESRCYSCEDACGCNGEVNCRVWVWRGREFTEAPKAMIVDALLRAVYERTNGLASNGEPYAGVPEDMRRFFAGKAQKKQEAMAKALSAPTSSCCGPTEQSACCGFSEKG